MAEPLTVQSFNKNSNKIVCQISEILNKQLKFKILTSLFENK